MGAPKLKRVEELFHRAVALPSVERADFLTTACAGDAALRAAVDELLRHDGGSDTFLVSPVAGAAQQHRQDVPTMLDVQNAIAPGPPPCLPTLPGYEFLEELGRGGMGVVYKARQTGLNRLVAVKMLLPDRGVTPEQLARFRIEAEALARLNHPNIVAIHDVGEHAGRPYFVFEYVPGPSLAQILTGRPQDPLASAWLIEQVARAIQAVHERGIIHRDLKPGNVLLQSPSASEGTASNPRWRSGSEHSPLTPKITDFGLAKHQSDDRKLTKTGMTLGTPCYMAPEQAMDTGDAVGPATDIYALGSILYEMLTGRPPFDAETPLATVMRLLHYEPLSPANLRPSLPRDLVTICLKCLEKSPRRRYASAGELADDLERFRTGRPIHARPVNAVERAYRWCRRRPLVTGLLALLGSLSVAFVVTVLIYNALLQAALDRLKEQSEKQHRQIIELNIEIGGNYRDSGDSFAALLFFAEALRLDERNPDQAAHRNRIATALRHCPHMVEVLDLEGSVLGAEVGVNGGRVATAGADGTVSVWEVPQRRQIASGLAHPETPINGTFSPDGRLLGTVTANGTAQIWNLDTGKARSVPSAKGPAIARLAFHPSGRFLLTEHANAGVRLWDLTTAVPTPIEQRAWREPVFAAASADAHWLFTADEENRGRLWDVAADQPACDAFALGDKVHQAAVSTDGRRVAVVGSAGIVRVWEVARGRPLGKPLALPLLDGGVSLSPDGRWLFACDVTGAEHIWDAETGQPRMPPLRHGGKCVCAAVDAKADRVLTLDKDGAVCIWEMGGDIPDAATRPIVELLALAQMHAAGRLDDRHVVQRLQASELHARWQTLHPELRK
jgi:serine/threonine protein kinase